MAGPEVTIVVRAKDQASKVLKGIGGSLQGLGKTLGSLPGPLGNLGGLVTGLTDDLGGLSGTAPGVTGLAGSLGSLSTVAVGLGVAAVAGVAALTAGLFKLGMAAIPVETTRLAFERLSKSIGESADVMLDEMGRAAKGTVSDAELMASANKLISMGLADSAEKAGELTEMAVVLGLAMGKGPTQAMEEFALMLANQSIPRLDTFGISAGRVRTRINELMAADKSLTRETAFLTAVTEEGAKSLERLGDFSGTAATSQGRMRTTMQNLKTTIGEQLVPALKEMFDLLTGILTVIKDLVDWIIRLKEALVELKFPEAFLAGARLAAGLPLGTIYPINVPELEKTVQTMMEKQWYERGIRIEGKPPIEYQFGGIVPGPIGRPQLAVVHGGETVTPPGGGRTININIGEVYGMGAYREAIEEAIAKETRYSL